MLRVLVVKVAVVCGEEYSKASARAGRSSQLRSCGLKVPGKLLWRGREAVIVELRVSSR